MSFLHKPLLQLSDLSSLAGSRLRPGGLLRHASKRKARARHRDRGAEKTATHNEKTDSVPEPSPKERELQDRVEALRRQLTEVQDALNRRIEDHESAVVETDQLKARLTQLDCLPQQVKEAQKKLEQEKESSNKAWELYEGAIAEAQQLRERLAELEDEAKSSGVRVSELEQARAEAERARRSSVELLEARTNELREAQIFLTKVDDITDDEVLHIVETLNAQIARTAAAVSRAPQFRFESQKDPAAMEKAIRRIEHYAWLGPSLVSSLSAADPARNNTLVQTALQAGLASYARWLATSWELGVVDPRGLLEGVYMAIRDRGA